MVIRRTISGPFIACSISSPPGPAHGPTRAARSTGGRAPAGWGGAGSDEFSTPGRPVSRFVEPAALVARLRAAAARPRVEIAATFPCPSPGGGRQENGAPMARSTSDRDSAFRRLPSMDEVLRDPRAAALTSRAPRALVLELLAAELADWREEIKEGRLDGVERAYGRVAPASSTSARARASSASSVAAWFAPSTRAASCSTRASAARPCTPRPRKRCASPRRATASSRSIGWSGERNQRDDYLSDLLRRLTGAEAAIGVNNNAGAVLLVFNTFAQGGRALVTRGELVEIGGVPGPERHGASGRRARRGRHHEPHAHRRLRGGDRRAHGARAQGPHEQLPRRRLHRRRPPPRRSPRSGATRA